MRLVQKGRLEVQLCSQCIECALGLGEGSDQASAWLEIQVIQTIMELVEPAFMGHLTLE